VVLGAWLCGRPPDNLSVETYRRRDEPFFLENAQTTGDGSSFGRSPIWLTTGGLRSNWRGNRDRVKRILIYDNIPPKVGSSMLTADAAKYPLSK
jgi:hypothetical protein